jgi:hypothetical protein
VVDDPSKIEQKIIPEYRKWYPLTDDQLSKDGKPHYSKITYDNGSVVYILTHEVNLLKLEGVEMTHLAFDEPPPRHVFIGLYRGGRVEGRPLEVFMAGTPLYQPWLRTEIYEKWVDGEMPDVECFAGETDDNTHLAEDYKRRFGAHLSEEEKATRFKGAFSDLSGQALAHLWQEKKHVIPADKFTWNEENPCVVVIDPHTSKPHHAVVLGVDRDNRFVVLEEVARKEIARNFAKTLADELKWFSKYRVIDIIYDSAGNAETTSGEGYRPFGTVFNEELAKRGIGKARATSYDDKLDEDFVDRIQEVLAVPETPDNSGQCLPKLRFLSTAKGSQRDVKQVQWQQNKKEGGNKPKLDIRNQDFLSCIKYGLASNLHYRKPKERIYTPARAAYGFKTRSQRGIKYKLP